MYNDYIIMTDENGEPYIAHWFGLGHRNPPKNHKYIAKINTPRGIRYFYTKADLDAYYFGQKVKSKLQNMKGRLFKKRKDQSQQAPSSTSNSGGGAESKPHGLTGRKRRITGTAKPGSTNLGESVATAQSNHASVAEAQSNHTIENANNLELVKAYSRAVADYGNQKLAYQLKLSSYGKAYDAYIVAKNRGESQETVDRLLEQKNKLFQQTRDLEKELRKSAIRLDDIKLKMKKKRDQ